MTLYDIAGQIYELQEMLESGDYDEETINDTMDSVMADFTDKTDDYGKLIRNMETDAEALKTEIKRLTERKRLIENGIQRIKDKLKYIMLSVGKKRIDGELFRFSVRNNAKQLPKQIPPDMVPEKFWIQQEPKMDRKALLKAVKDGEVMGIELNQSQSLSIT